MLLNCFLPSRSRCVRVGRAWVAGGLLLGTARLLAVYPEPSVTIDTPVTTGTATIAARQTLVMSSAVTAQAGAAVSLAAGNSITLSPGFSLTLAAGASLSATLGPIDTDGDGLSDVAELAVGLQPDNPLDAWAYVPATGGGSPTNSKTSGPHWWGDTHGLTVAAIKPGATADDYAAINQGQLRHLARHAFLEMELKLPGGAGSTLRTTWASPAALNDDYAAMNVGQLKALAKPFYDRLIALGLTTSPAWFTSSSTTDNYALANIGQAKHLFAWGLTRLPDLNYNGYADAWEHNYFNQLGAAASAHQADADSDGISNMVEYLLRENPIDTTLPTSRDALNVKWKARSDNQDLGLVVFTP